MPNVYWSKNAFASSGNQTSSGDAREAEESASQTLDQTSSNAIAIESYRNSLRGGATYRYQRCYWAFDMSSYSTGTITNLKFNYKPTTSTQGSLGNSYLIKTDAFGSNTNFNAYAAASWYESLNYGVAYSSGFTYVDSSSAQQITLNSTATSQISNNSMIQICMVTNADYTGLGLIADANNAGYMNVGSNTGGNTYLSFDYADAGYPNAVISVAAANISKINSIATANIDKVNSVS